MDSANGSCENASGYIRQRNQNPSRPHAITSLLSRQLPTTPRAVPNNLYRVPSMSKLLHHQSTAKWDHESIRMDHKNLLQTVY